MRTKDPRKERINELKNLIKETNKTLLEKLTAAASDEEKKELKDLVAVQRASIQAAKENLKLVRINKNGSSAFEYHPHKGMNRRQAKQYKHSRRRRADTPYGWVNHKHE